MTALANVDMNTIATIPMTALQDQEEKIIKYIIQNPKVREVVYALQGGALYFNELYDKVGGNRTALAEILHKLEKNEVISSKWEIKEIQQAKGTPTSRAVKIYFINLERRNLIESYAKLISPNTGF